MVVSVDHDIHAVRDLPSCGLIENIPVTGTPRPDPEFGKTGGVPGEGGPQVRVKQSKEAHAMPVFQDAAAQAEPPVGPDFVSVGDVDRETLMGDRDRTAGEFNAELLGEVLARPEVVIAGQVDHAHAGFHQVVEFEQDAGAGRRDGCAVLEPEVEEIANNIERPGVVADRLQKVDQDVFPLAGCISHSRRPDVYVGYEVDSVQLSHL